MTRRPVPGRAAPAASGDLTGPAADVAPTATAAPGTPVRQTLPSANATVAAPATIDALIAVIQTEFPTAGIRITGRARTIRRQAELMAERIRANQQEFLSTYRPATHITEMSNWCTANPEATLAQTVDQFETIITAARARGALVSNHLSDSARDISWPNGTPQVLNEIEARIVALGGSVIREPLAAGGRHWHVDW